MPDSFGTHVVGGHEGSEVCWINPTYDENEPEDLAPLTLEATATLFTAERERLAAQGLKMVRREEWGARRTYTDTRAVTMPARRFFLHVAVIGSAGSFTSRMRTIESIGISRFPNTGISYNAAVDFDGTLAEAQPLARRGAHTVVEYAPNKMGLPNGHNANYDSRALVLPQNCPDRVTDEQIHSAAKWAAAQIRAGLAVKGARWFGHRDAAPKSCPCDAGYARIPWLQRLTDQYAADGLSPTPPPEDDVTPDDIKAIANAVWSRTWGDMPGVPAMTALDQKLDGLTAAVKTLTTKVDALAAQHEKPESPPLPPGPS